MFDRWRLGTRWEGSTGREQGGSVRIGQGRFFDHAGLGEARRCRSTDIRWSRGGQGRLQVSAWARMKTLDEAHGDVKLGLSVFVPRSVSTSTFTIGRGLGLGVDRLDGSPTQVLGYGSTRVEFRMGRGRSWAVMPCGIGIKCHWRAIWSVVILVISLTPSHLPPTPLPLCMSGSRLALFFWFRYFHWSRLHCAYLCFLVPVGHLPAPCLVLGSCI